MAEKDERVEFYKIRSRARVSELVKSSLVYGELSTWVCTIKIMAPVFHFVVDLGVLHFLEVFDGPTACIASFLPSCKAKNIVALKTVFKVGFLYL